MSLFRNIIKMLGFGPDDSEELQDSPEAASTAQSAQPTLLPASGEAKVDEKAEAAIFEKVVEVFDASLPEFLGSNADRQKQCDFLFACLDESMQAYVKGLRAAAMAECEAQWMQERSQLQANADELRARAKQLEEKKAELNDSKLSADRQKRALADRVRDLEEQVLKLESDKEQLEIENKCMVNKAKAAAVLGQDASAADGEQLARMEALIAELQAERDGLAEEKASMAKAIEAAEVKDKMNAAMFDDFKRQASEATKALKEEQQAGEEIRKEHEILLARIADLQREVGEKDARLQEQVATIDEIEQIQKQVALFDDVKSKMDEHIARLKNALKMAQQENTSLRDTIKKNMTQNAEDMQHMQQRIDELQARLSESAPTAAGEAGEAAPQPHTPKRQRRRTVVLEDVDELIQGADWMVSTPPHTASMRPSEDNDSFGYQPPQRKQKIVDSDSQPSLFDL